MRQRGDARTAHEELGGAQMDASAAPRPPRPWVTLHFAQSLDGRIATRSGHARWISGRESTQFAHRLRAESDAVLVGSGTAIADDPLLTVRHVDGPHPRRIVLDARARLSPTAKLATDRTAPTVQATRDAGRSALPPHVARWELPAGADGVGIDLAVLLERLHGEGARRVLVEGGRRVITAFLRAGLVDRMIVSIAPMVIGAGIDAVGDLGTEHLGHALRFATRRLWRLGEDVLVELAPAAQAVARPGTADTAIDSDPQRAGARLLAGRSGGGAR